MMRAEWQGFAYNVLTKNCHHFSQALCERLGVGPLPAWLNGLATTGAEIAELVDGVDSGYDGGEALAELLSHAKLQLYNAFVAEREWHSEDDELNLADECAGSG